MSLQRPEPNLDPELARAGDVARFWRVPRYDALECLAATFRRHAYARHTHETYALAAITDGCETFHHRGEQRYAGAGAIAIVCPGEPHDGEPHGDRFAYRTLYPSIGLMRRAAEDVAGRALPRAPTFRASVVEDPELFAAILALHRGLEAAGGADDLDRDERMLAVLARLVRRFGDVEGPPAAPAGARAVAVARDKIEADYAQPIGLDDLAALAGASRAQLVRGFRAQTGLTPHAYLTDRRVRAAAALLREGRGPAEVAVAVGLCDQSHLNRVFKERIGVTPGAYRTR